MLFSLSQKRVSYLYVQRNLFAGLTMILLATNLLQSLFLLLKTEKTIITPPELKQSYWVEGNKFAPSYLEEMGLYFCHLMLDVSESNILYQGDVLLRYVEPSAHGVFRQKLLKDQARLKKEQLSLHFLPLEINVLPKTLEVEVTGMLISYVGSKRVTESKETYRLSFSQTAGRLFLKAVTSPGEESHEA